MSPGPPFGTVHVLGAFSQRVTHSTPGVRRLYVFTIRLPPPGGPTAKAEMRPETQALPRGLAPPPVSGGGSESGKSGSAPRVGGERRTLQCPGPGVLSFSLGSKSWSPTPQRGRQLHLCCVGVVCTSCSPGPPPPPIRRW